MVESETNSTHKVEVVEVKLRPHPNADSLSLVDVFDGYTVAVKTEDWLGVDIGAYIPPDSVVPETEEFSFLGNHRRIKVKKLRGVASMGMLIKVPDGFVVGDNIAQYKNITHYDVSVPGSGVVAKKAPLGYHPVYNIDSLRRYSKSFSDGEVVHVTEKIHGSNARFLFDGNEYWAGSKERWLEESSGGMWWRALNETNEGELIKKFITDYPDTTVYGEVYGNQDLKYGKNDGNIGLSIFDILKKDGKWSDAKSRWKLDFLPWVPFICEAPFSKEYMFSLAEGRSLVTGAGNIREGVVVKPMEERCDERGNRICLKVVSNNYLMRE